MAKQQEDDDDDCEGDDGAADVSCMTHANPSFRCTINNAIIFFYKLMLKQFKYLKHFDLS